MDVDIDSGCCMANEPGMALGSSLGRDITKAPDNKIGHPDQYGPGRQHGPWTPA